MKLGRWSSDNRAMAIIAFICIIVALLIIVITPPASVYEISIYNVYPWYFWFFIIIAIFIGQLIILKNAINVSKEEKYNSWLLGLLVILIPIIILLFIPEIRGYPTYSTGDSFFHTGVIKDILQFGNVKEDLFYPNLHILTAEVILITGGSVINLINIIPRFFFILAPISFYLLFLIILKNKNEMKFAMIFTSSFLFFGTYFMDLFPYYNSFLLMAIILFLYFKRGLHENTISFSILFIIIIVSFIFYHPLNSLLLILIFLFLVVIFYIFTKIKYLKITELPEKNIKEKSLNILLFTVLHFSIWYLSFVSIVGSFFRVYKSIFYGLGESMFASQSASLSAFSPPLIDILKIIIFTYGVLFIIGFLSFVCFIYMFIKWWKNKQNFLIRFSFIFSGIVFMVFGVLVAGGILFNFIVDWNRFLLWLIIFSIILVAVIYFPHLSRYSNKNSFFISIKKIIQIISIYIVFLSLTFLSIFTFYPSPIIGTGQVNPQVTQTEWKGTEWFQNHSNRQILTAEFGITIWRYYLAIYGLKNQTLKLPIGYTYTQPPDHFSYQNKTYLGQNYNESRYLIITRLGKIRYPESNPNYKRFWRFTPEDFNQLHNDTTVNRLYDNGGFEIYFVKTKNMTIIY